MTDNGDLEEARQQIDAIRERIINRYDWELHRREEEDTLTLFVRMPGDDGQGEYLLRLVFNSSFPVEKPRESFRNPEDPSEGGREFWPEGGAFKRKKQKICLQGVYGCDNDLHAGEYDPDAVTVEDTLIAIQRHINQDS